MKIDLYKVGIIVLSLVLLLGFASGYDGEGGSEPLSACSDGDDNDGDGDVDGDDNGCTQPYAEDDDEANIWDTHITNTFDGTSPTESYHTIAFPSQVKKTNQIDGPAAVEDETLSDGIKQTYISGETADSSEVTSFMEGTLLISEGRALAPPNPGNEGGNSELVGEEQTCGDGIQNSGDWDQGVNNPYTECPEDWGMPADTGSATYSGTTTITDEAGTYDATDTVSIGDSGDDTDDDVTNEFNLVAPEASGSITDDPITDACTTDSCSDEERVYEDQNWEKVPDFFRSGPDSISMVYPKVVRDETFDEKGGTITDWGRTYNGEKTDKKGSKVTWDTGCSGNCSSRTVEACTDTTDATYKEAQLKQEEVSIGADTKRRGTQGSETSWSEDSADTSFEVSVTRDVKDGKKEQPYTAVTGCGGKTDYYCDGGDCELSGEQSGWKSSTLKYHDDFKSSEVEFKYEFIELKEQKVFDLNPPENPSSGPVNSKEALFEGDYNLGNVVSHSSGGEAYWTYDDGSDRTLDNDHTTSSSSFDIVVDNGEFKSERDFFGRWNADGHYGYGDGFAVINEKSGGLQTTMDVTGEDEVGSKIYHSGSGNSVGSVRGKIDETCSGDRVVCLKYYDFYTEADTFTGDRPVIQAEEVEEFDAGTYSVCKSLTWMVYQNGGEDGIQCNYDPAGEDPEFGSEGPAPSPCGSVEGEEWREMEGNEVDEPNVLEGDHQTCVQTKNFDGNPCVYYGEPVEEGSQRNIAAEKESYEAGTPTPDLEVCWRGRWYDKDSTKNINVGSMDSFRKTNFNPPYHPVHNPTGGDTGTALEDDCGNSRFVSLNCDDSTTGYPHVYSPFSNGASDDDQNTFTGVANRLMEDSNQLEPGMDTNSFNMSDAGDSSIVSDWDDTRGGDNADEWAITPSIQWVIDSTGTPYPPYDVYYKNEYLNSGGDRRTSMMDETVNKTSKAFGNSFAAVDRSSQNGLWIDPDDIRDYEDSHFLTATDSGWRQAVRNIGADLDLTGPDSGIAYDLEEGGDSSSNPGYIDEIHNSAGIDTVFADVRWQRNSPINPSLEPPVCGDDQEEYLLEEAGESANSVMYDGKYACADARNYCVSFQGSGSRVYELGQYQQAGERAEDSGRLKNDREICDMRDASVDDYPVTDHQGVWYDQDFSQEYCRVNNLYGSEARRWIDSEYVDNHPEAVNEGVDDDLNPYLENQGISTLESNPNTYSGGSGETPVTAGEPEDSIDPRTVTKGFCGGDEESEYVITQRCNTDLCETDNSYLGVADDPDKCILEENSSLKNGVDVSGGKDGEVNRDIYDEGEKVEVGNKVMGCFNGEWNDEWPVYFSRKEVNVSGQDDERVSFRIINVLEEPVTFDLMLDFPNTEEGNQLDSRTYFEQTNTNQMSVQLGSYSSEFHNIVVRSQAVNDNISLTEANLSAEARDVELSGYDIAEIGINVTGSVSGSQVNMPNTEQREVPGITVIQVFWLTMMASVIYFFTTGRNL